MPNSSNPRSQVNLPGNPFNDEPLEVTLADVFRILSYHRALVRNCVLSFFVIAVLYSFFGPKTYEAISKLKYDEKVQIVDSMAVAEKTILSLNLMARPEFAGLNDRDLINFLQKAVLVKIDKDLNLITIQAHSSDPQLAANLANTWAQTLIQQTLDLKKQLAVPKYQFIHNQFTQLKDKLDHEKNQSKISESELLQFNELLEQDREAQLFAESEDPGIVIVDKAEVPDKPIAPKKRETVLLGTLLGLIVGVFIALGLEKINDRIKTEDDLVSAFGFSPLGSIPDLSKGTAPQSPKEHFKPTHQIDNNQLEYSPYGESFNLLSESLIARLDKKSKVIGVFSVNPKEKASVVNVDLAVSLSFTGKRVLLIDENLRKPSLGEFFDISAAAGSDFLKALAGKRKIEEMVVKTQFENLWILLNHSVTSNPSALLGSEPFKKLIEDLKNQFDFIVIDGAPLFPVADSVTLSKVLDGVMLMATYNQTHKTEFLRALQLLRAVNAPLAGTVLKGGDIKKVQGKMGVFSPTAKSGLS